ncbi:pentatricopeptide repeat-containing protein At1g52620 isoform X1 [Impatiens glandulifera]|uniref:pentatricopeptide repeat-containing protein At1g52620 isoform X1 n=2 Tax=Impatiens glandulifera TaxID=253017 RepID=UPI001FB10790|nr:pentatricopeptide repeat-containing protein At1g52620 isoform X1 [Impatiens glandulifera]
MSTRLLSRIKPRHELNSSSKPNFSPPLPIHIKSLINQVCEILKTNEKWEENLDNLLSQEEIVPSDVAGLVFSHIQDAELGLKFLDWIDRRPYGCPLDGYAYSPLLNLLAKSRIFTEIETLLKIIKDNGESPTVQAYSSIIASYSDSGLIDKAYEIYKTAVSPPNVFACNSLLNALVKNNRNEIARQVYDEMLQRDIIDDYSTGIIVKGLCKQGKIDEGRTVIHERYGTDCIPNIVFYNTLIDGYFRNGDFEKACELFKELKLKGVLPSVRTYGSMINGYCKVGKFEAVDKLLNEMKARGLDNNVEIYNTLLKHGWGKKEIVCEPDIVTYNTRIHTLCKNGSSVEKPLEVVKEAIRNGMEVNKLTYTPIIQCYCRKGEFVNAFNLLIEMTNRGITADVVTYGILIHGLVSAGKIDLALEVRDKMVERGVYPDACIYNVLMNGFCKKGRLSTARELLVEMIDRNVRPDSNVYATLIDGFVRNNEIEGAKQIFENDLDPDVACYNAMIKGFCKLGQLEEAVIYVRRMEKAGKAPDEYTFSTLIDGFVKHNDFKSAFKTIREMVTKKFKPGVIIYTSLINGYCRLGDTERAKELFNEMSSDGLVPNTVTYTAIISGFCKHGKLEEAASFFHKMLSNKCVPNEVTFGCLVNGFSVSNEIIESASFETTSLLLSVFRTMVSDGFDRKTAANDAIVASLCLHGMTKIALQWSNRIFGKGFLSHSVTFTSLLHGVCLEGGSRNWKNVLECNLDESGLCVAVKYSMILDKYVRKDEELTLDDATEILKSLLKEHRNIRSGIL